MTSLEINGVLSPKFCLATRYLVPQHLPLGPCLSVLSCAQ